MNGSFEFIGVPDPLRTNGPYWIGNILVIIPDWGAIVTVTTLNWGSQRGVCYDGASILWCGAFPARTDNLSRSLEIRAPLRAVSVTISFE